jgi:hypothetical protein
MVANHEAGGARRLSSRDAGRPRSSARAAARERATSAPTPPHADRTAGRVAVARPRWGNPTYREMMVGVKVVVDW